MSSGGMSYFVRTPEGKEYGPVDRDQLLTWAKDGRLTLECQVRNSLVQNWMPPEKAAFLAEALAPALAARQAQEKAGQPLTVKAQKGASLNRDGVFHYKAATPGLRLIAWLIDTALLGGIAFAVLSGAHSLAGSMEGDTEILYVLAVALIFFLVLVYYTVLLGLRAQTPGQQFSGIMVVKPNGDPVLLGRAYVFTLFYLLLGWTTALPLLILPSRRALQDFLSGLIVIRITNRE